MSEPSPPFKWGENFPSDDTSFSPFSTPSPDPAPLPAVSPKDDMNSPPENVTWMTLLSQTKPSPASVFTPASSNLTENNILFDDTSVGYNTAPAQHRVRRPSRRPSPEDKKQTGPTPVRPKKHSPAPHTLDPEKQTEQETEYYDLGVPYFKWKDGNNIFFFTTEPPPNITPSMEQYWGFGVRYLSPKLGKERRKNYQKRKR